MSDPISDSGGTWKKRWALSLSLYNWTTQPIKWEGKSEKNIPTEEKKNLTVRKTLLQKRAKDNMLCQ